MAVLLREMFDLRRMPLQDTPTAHDQLLGLHVLPRLKKRVSEALAMRFCVRDNWASLMQPKFSKDASYFLILSLTGARSIFEALFKRFDVCS